MAIKVVELDSDRLATGAEFPPLGARKYGLEEFPCLMGGDVLDYCWRAQIVALLSPNIRVDRETMQKMSRLQLLITVGDAVAQLDQAAAYAQGIELLASPGRTADDAAAAQALCNRVSQAIDHHLRSRDGWREAP